MFKQGDLLQSRAGNFQVIVMSTSSKFYKVANASDFTPNSEWELNIPRFTVESNYNLAMIQGKVKIEDRQLPYFKVRNKLT
jgi:hypothetical protein